VFMIIKLDEVTYGRLRDAADDLGITPVEVAEAAVCGAMESSERRGLLREVYEQHRWEPTGEAWT